LEVRIQDFYKNLKPHNSFQELIDPKNYVDVPSDWFLGVADIENSTQEIKAGRYKVVNSVGAAVISAQINGAKGKPFPYVFGGDGAAFAFWLEQSNDAINALREVKRWAIEEFDIKLRAAIVPISDIRKANRTVRVAKYCASPNAEYAMFEGGGLRWAEDMMKAGQYGLEAAPEGSYPDLEGLSCRWTRMQPKNDRVVSLIIVPQEDARPSRVADVMNLVVNFSEKLNRYGHPAPIEGPGVGWPPEGLDIEARATHGNGSLLRRKAQLAVETLLAWIVIKTGIKVGKFDPAHYTRSVSENADFRKFDDGLKMTLDCDHKSIDQLKDVLDTAKQEGLIRYGLFEQDEALMTCIVPSVYEDNHVHFVDGASGGYAMAAAMMK
jgi:hypothetical protein